MSVYKRGDTYWYDLWVEGRRYRGATGRTNKAVALQFEAEKRLELLHGKTPQKALFSAFVKEEFLPWSKAEATPSTHKRYVVSTKPLLRHLGPMRMDWITTADVERFKLKRLEECSPAGVNRDMAALRFICNFGIRTGYLEHNPVKHVRFLKEGPGMMRIVSYEEERAYLVAAFPLQRDIAILMLDTGMRPKEVYSIRKEDVHLAKKYIFIPEGKTRFARRSIPLTERAIEVLVRRMKAAKRPAAHVRVAFGHGWSGSGDVERADGALLHRDHDALRPSHAGAQTGGGTEAGGV
jgi:integrase